MEEKRQYLEYFDGAFDSTVADKMKPENKPYVAYSKTEGVVYTVIPEEPTSAYQMVDLGLPSGLKWADRNVGASSPEDAGLYFQWGDTVGYTADQVGVDKMFDWNNYKFGVESNLTKYNSNDGLKVLESIDDTATSHMGSQYRMPTIDEILELRDNTIQTHIDVNGNEYDNVSFENKPIKQGKLKGVRFTGPNGNSIFIPAAGSCTRNTVSGQSERTGKGTACNLWSSSLGSYIGSAKNVIFNYIGHANNNAVSRCFGLSIRGVQA